MLEFAVGFILGVFAFITGLIVRVYWEVLRWETRDKGTW